MSGNHRENLADFRQKLSLFVGDFEYPVFFTMKNRPGVFKP
jgi:hypothetical protein